MLSTLVPIIGAGVGAVGLWQLWVRWRAHRTDQFRVLAAEMRETFQDVVNRQGLDSAAFMSGPRQTLETRLRDLHGQLHDHVLRDRVDHLLKRWRSLFAFAPAPRIGFAWIGDDVTQRFTTDSPERRTQVKHQVDTARDGLIEVESVLDRCNQLALWVVGG